MNKVVERFHVRREDVSNAIKGGELTAQKFPTGTSGSKWDYKIRAADADAWVKDRAAKANKLPKPSNIPGRGTSFFA